MCLSAVAASSPPAMIVPGQFNVGATGAASYTIPIAVPPGTAGMVPALSLDYSSQSGDGIAGLGWSLSGLPSIGRCPRTLSQDSVHGGVNYDSNDRFCMEGQRLVAVTGTYGAAGTVYRTEIDGFSKIVSYGSAGNGPAYFKVWTKAGQVMEFGNTTDSRLLAVGKTTARSWAVNKISDTKGNYLTVTYQNDTTNGQAYPTRIDYTGNAGVSPYNSVQFAYNTARPDVTPTYQAGSLQQTTVLLTDVKTYQGANLVYDYKLAYRLGSSTTHSRLTQLTLCDVNNACLAPTTFNWQGGTGTTTLTSQNISFTSTFVSNLIFGDYNGDGILDVLPFSTTPCGVQLGNGNGTYTAGGPAFQFHTYEYMDTVTPTWKAFVDDMCSAQDEVDPYALDLDGDGLTDLIIRARDSSGNAYFKVLFNNGTEVATPAGYTDIWQVGDFDGDGRSDFLTAGSSSYVYYNGGGGTFTAGSVLSGLGGLYATRIPADFDGDGCTDVLVQGSGYTPIVKYFCNPAVSQASATNWVANGNAIVFGDFNGDGKTDVLATNSSGATLYLSTGTGFASGIAISGSSDWSKFSISAGDFNGDGKYDLILVADGLSSHYGVSTAHQVWLSTGAGFVEATTIANSGNSADNPQSGQPSINARIGDLNGDGAQDIWIEKPSGDVQYFSSFALELMVSVSNGIGATTAITYDRLNKNGSLYTKCPSNPSVYTCGDAYPIVGLDGAFYVVSRVDASNGIGGTYSSTYTYAGAKAELRGRGFLGFTSMTVTDLQTGVVQTTNYHTDYPYVGLIASQTKTSGSVTLNATSNTFADSSEGTGTEGVGYHFVSLSQSSVTAHDLDGSAMPTSTTAYTYDSYGNAQTVNVSLSDGSSKNTTNTYTNDTTNWFLGRLTNTSVVSTVPDRGTGGTAGNSAPTASNDSITTNENTPVSFDPRSNDSDPDGDALTIVSTSVPSHGVVAINGGTSLTYTPASMYSGSDSFTYTISDGQGHIAIATVSVTVTYVAPPSGTFAASASPIAPGSSSTLSWTSSGATTATIDSGVGTVTPVSSGSVTVSPAATTTYTLTLTGLGGTTTKQVTVTVVPTPTGTFAASPTSIGIGSSSTLTWSSANATSASISGVGSVTPVAGGSATVTPSVTTTYTLTLTGPTGTITKQAIVTVVGTPSGTLTASPATINLGGSSTLSWSTTNTTSASINNGIGSVSPSSGSVTVSPTATTTYTLTMSGLAGTNTATATVTIPAPTGSFSASSTAFARGGSTTLSWSSTNATSASIDNGVGGVSTSGSVSVSPTATTTYTLTLTGPSGTVTYPVSITVYQPPTASLSASPTTVNLGSQTTLSWSTTNATSVSIDNGIGAVGTSGSVAVTPASSKTYTLTASGSGGSTTAQASVTIPGPSGSFSASAGSISVGGSSTLSWSSSNATTASIDNGVGSVTASGGSVSVSPSATTTYTLTLNGPSGSTTKQVTINVYPVPTASISASPSSINQGASSTLSWSSSNAASASIDNGVGSVATSGSTTVAPSAPTTYTLTVTNAVGATATSSTAIAVNRAPTAVNDSAVYAKTLAIGAKVKPTLNVSVLANDSDPDGDTLTVTGVTNGSSGTTTIVATGSGTVVNYTYKSYVTTDLFITDTFTYTMSDGHSHTATATVTVSIQVASVN